MPGSICISDKQKNGTHNNWVQYLGQTFTKKVFVGLGVFFLLFFATPQGTWNLSSPIMDQTHIPCIGSTESWLLVNQGSPKRYLLFTWKSHLSKYPIFYLSTLLLDNTYTQRDFLSHQGVKNLLSNAGDMGFISGQGTKIPAAAGQLSLCAAPREKPLCTTTKT